MEVTLHLPDDIAEQFAAGADLERAALEAIALEGFRSRRLSISEVAELFGISRMEAQDFVGRNKIPLADLTPEDLEREAAVLAKFASAQSVAS